MHHSRVSSGLPASVRNLQVFLAILLLPMLVEAIDNARLAIAIPGFPLTVGRSLFVISGMGCLLVGGFYYFRSAVTRGMMLIAAATCIGALFSGEVAGNLSGSAGLFLLLVGTVGSAQLCARKSFRLLLDVFFMAALTYWLIYLVRFAVAGDFRSYSELYGAGEMGLENHHEPGIIISVASAYLAVRFFFRDQRLRAPGYAVFAIGLAACLVLESRSNFGFTALALIVILATEKKSLVRNLLVVVPLLAATYVGLNSFVSDKEAIRRRFNVEDFSYQGRSVGPRLRFLVAAGDAIVTRPFGSGIKNIKLRIDNKRLLVHNQYVTYVIAGGIVGFAGVTLWLWGIMRALAYVYWRNRHAPDSFLSAAGIATLTLHLTLLTIEYSGAYFFVVLCLLMYISALATYQQTVSAAATYQLMPRGPEADLSSPTAHAPA